MKTQGTWPRLLTPRGPWETQDIPHDMSGGEGLMLKKEYRGNISGCQGASVEYDITDSSIPFCTLSKSPG